VPVVTACSTWRWCPGTIAVPGLARAATDTFLRQVSATPQMCLDARLVVSELVANAVRHGGAERSWVELRLEDAGPALRGSVRHPGAGFVPPATPSAEMVRGGRGLLLVAALTSAWGVTVGDGTTVWFEIERC
jgi:anti-sigma regulatory factor (Ser/Thr protein kinase)